MEGASGGVFTGMSCQEAETFAHLFTVAEIFDVVDIILAEHAEGDTPWDDHYRKEA